MPSQLQNSELPANAINTSGLVKNYRNISTMSPMNSDIYSMPFHMQLMPLATVHVEVAVLDHP
jgi:hypothetical protein